MTTTSRVAIGSGSGPGAWAMRPGWGAEIYHQCRATGVTFFFKPWGGGQEHRRGRELFGRSFDEMPVGTPPQKQEVPLRA